MHPAFSAIHNVLGLSKSEPNKHLGSAADEGYFPEKLVTENPQHTSFDFPEKPTHEPTTELIQPIERLPAPLYAIVIGIDRYGDFNSSVLQGASNDAYAVHEFLTDVIGVPSDQILLLLDESASRENIIRALKALANDKRIQHGDAILIYFAGHGTQVNVESGEESAKLQAILPQDFNGSDVHPITEYALDGIIAAIHEEKGDNITLILDCGYSEAPALLGLDSATYSARGVTLQDDYVIPYEHDSERCIISHSVTRGINIVEAAIYPSTHVLLGACSSTNYAQERNGRGLFTTAVLELLATNDFNGLSCATIAAELGLRGLYIQSEGLHLDRPIFGDKLTTSAICYKAKLMDATSCLVQAGMIHDVNIGARFDLYLHSAAIGRLSPVASAIVQSSGPFESCLHLPNTLPHSFLPGKSFIAVPASFPVSSRESRTPKLGLYLGSDRKLDLVRQTLADLGSSSSGKAFQLVTDPSKAQLEISSIQENGITMVMVEIYDDFILKHQHTNFRTKVASTTNNISLLLNRAAHFFRQLHSSFVDPRICDNVKIEFCELRGRKRNLVVGDDLLCGGQLRLEINRAKKALHGIRLMNNTDADLYLNAFYFDCSQLSIMHYYGMARQDRPRHGAPLPAHSTLTLGYGSEPSSALKFFIPPERTDDLGFFKFIFTTKPVDLGSITCSGPFEDSLTSKSMSSPRTSSSVPWEQAHPQPDAVMSVSVPVILRETAIIF